MSAAVGVLRPLARAALRRLPPFAGGWLTAAVRAADTPVGYARFARDLVAYRRLAGAEPVRVADLFPQVHDRLPFSPLDPHYFYQAVWATERVRRAAPARHLDVGSQVSYVGTLSTLTPVTFVDIRPLAVDLPNLTSVAGSVLALPLPDRSQPSVSCLHVAEHIGLGRYGDELDPGGTRKAARELARVVAPGGQLLFSLPIGRARLCFNAHRVHAPADVVAMFPDLRLAEFSAVDDAGRLREDLRPQELADADYACGLFRLVRDA